MFAINPSTGANRCADTHAALDALCDAVDWAHGGVSLSRSRRRFVDAGPRAGLSEILADPIVKALMVADSTDRDSIEAMMRGVAAWLGSRKPAAVRSCINKGTGQ